MHEVSLIADLMRKIDAIAREQGGARVVGLTVELGALSHISASHFREHFEHESAGTAAAGAELRVVERTDPNEPHAQEIRLVSVEVE